MSQALSALKWRYATKQFDPEKKLSEKQLETLKEVLRLAPSSYGLQPWHFILVEDAELRKKLRAAGYDQPQITDASHFLVMTSKKNINEKLADEYIKKIATTRNIPLQSLEGFGNMLKGDIQGKTEEGRRNWAAKQVYIALGVLIAAAAIEGIDAAPMEGFDPKQFDVILGLDKQNLESRVIVALGFRKADDPAAHMAKVRYSEEEMFTRV